MPSVLDYYLNTDSPARLRPDPRFVGPGFTSPEQELTPEERRRLILAGDMPGTAKPANGLFPPRERPAAGDPTAVTKAGPPPVDAAVGAPGVAPSLAVAQGREPQLDGPLFTTTITNYKPGSADPSSVSATGYRANGDGSYTGLGTQTIRAPQPAAPAGPPSFDDARRQLFPWLPDSAAMTPDQRSAALLGHELNQRRYAEAQQEQGRDARATADIAGRKEIAQMEIDGRERLRRMDHTPEAMRAKAIEALLAQAALDPTKFDPDRMPLILGNVDAVLRNYQPPPPQPGLAGSGNAPVSPPPPPVATGAISAVDRLMPQLQAAFGKVDRGPDGRSVFSPAIPTDLSERNVTDAVNRLGAFDLTDEAVRAELARRIQKGELGDPGVIRPLVGRALAANTLLTQRPQRLPDGTYPGTYVQPGRFTLRAGDRTIPQVVGDVLTRSPGAAIDSIYGAIDPNLPSVYLPYNRLELSSGETIPFDSGAVLNGWNTATPDRVAEARRRQPLLDRFYEVLAAPVRPAAR